MTLIMFNALTITELGMDPKSPAGIASSFSRPNSGAIHMSNVSLLLEFASEEFLNHIEQ